MIYLNPAYYYRFTIYIYAIYACNFCTYSFAQNSDLSDTIHIYIELCFLLVCVVVHLCEIHLCTLAHTPIVPANHCNTTKLSTPPEARCSSFWAAGAEQSSLRTVEQTRAKCAQKKKNKQRERASERESAGEQESGRAYEPGRASRGWTTKISNEM